MTGIDVSSPNAFNHHAFKNLGTPGEQPETQGKPERLDSFDKIFKEPNNQDVPANTNEGYPNWSEDPFAMPEAFPEPAP